MAMAFTIRLDSADTPEITSVRRQALVTMLADYGQEYLAVEERKGISKQVHWHAVVWTDGPKANFLKAMKPLKVGIKEYSVVIARKIDNATRYLCKGQDETLSSEVVVVCSKGERFTPEFIATQHALWYEVAATLGRKRAPRTQERISMLDALYEELAAQKEPVTLELCSDIVVDYCLDKRKLLAETTQVHAARMLCAMFNPEYKMQMKFNQRYVCRQGYYLCRTVQQVDDANARIQAQEGAPASESEEESEDDPIDSGVQTAVCQEEDGGIKECQRSQSSRQLHEIFYDGRSAPRTESSGCVEVYKRQQEFDDLSVSEIYSVRGGDRSDDSDECAGRYRSVPDSSSYV